MGTYFILYVIFELTSTEPQGLTLVARNAVCDKGGSFLRFLNGHQMTRINRLEMHPF